MAVLLGELIKQMDENTMKMIAGDKGKANLVDWVHMVETTEIAGFMTGGEIAFTTGIGINEDMTVLDLVMAVYKKGASGMVINIGPYIHQIGQAVIDFGNAHDFPIFEVPWEVHMADIMRMFSETITRSNQRAMELSAGFKNAIFSPKMEELYLPVLMQKGYFSEWEYVVAVIDICNCVKQNKKNHKYIPISTERFVVIQKMIEKRIVSMKYDAVIYQDQEKLLIIFSDTDEEGACGILKKLYEQIKSFLKSNEVVFMSVGKTADQIRTICQSYVIAHRIAEFLKLEKMENNIKGYSKMGIAKIFLNLNQLDCLKGYYEDTIGPLDDYDEANDSNLVETLICYIRHNGSVQDTAEEMYTHRNTVNYKLKKIETILRINLKDFEVRNQLMIGLLAKKMCLLR